jgi:DNA polymerase III subunit chi
MGVVMFYHLTQSGADDTLLTLIGRARARDWRVMVRGRDAAHLARLDEMLWLQPADGFLAHGVAGGPMDADQPVLLGQGPVTNGARVLALIDGALLSVDEVAGLERVWVLFDDADKTAVDAARGLWRQVTDAGHPAQYWTENSGIWQMKMEKTAG